MHKLMLARNTCPTIIKNPKDEAYLDASPTEVLDPVRNTVSSGKAVDCKVERFLLPVQVTVRKRMLQIYNIHARRVFFYSITWARF